MPTLTTVEPPKRITATRVIELMHEERMAVASRPSRERDSFALGRSARGETTVDIKFYAQDDESSDDLLARTWEAYERTIAKFPMSSGYVVAKADA